MDAHNCTRPPHFPPHCGCPAVAPPPVENASSTCICGDGVHSITGCPQRGHRMYSSCPNREGLFRLDTLKESA